MQGALYAARALASGVGPLAFAQLFAWFTRTDSPLPYFPGAPFVLGAVLMVGALAVAASIPADAEAAHQKQQAAWEAGEAAQQQRERAGVRYLLVVEDGALGGELQQTAPGERGTLLPAGAVPPHR